VASSPSDCRREEIREDRSGVQIREEQTGGQNRRELRKGQSGSSAKNQKKKR
jgi:hypothetical protein